MSPAAAARLFSKALLFLDPPALTEKDIDTRAAGVVDGDVPRLFAASQLLDVGAAGRGVSFDLDLPRATLLLHVIVALGHPLSMADGQATE